MDEETKCPLSDSIVKDFKLEILLLNKKYDFLIDLNDSNFFQVNHFLKKIGFGLGWWLVILTLFFDLFLSAFTSSIFRVLLGK